MKTFWWLLPARAQVCHDPKSLFGGGPTLPAPPAITPPPTMPDPNSPDALAARKLAITKAMNGGRQSTQLTTAPLAAGGGAASFTSTKTGG
jgi:hypothetical protein